MDETVTPDFESLDLESVDERLCVDCNVDRIDKDFQCCLRHRAIEE